MQDALQATQDRVNKVIIEVQALKTAAQANSSATLFEPHVSPFPAPAAAGVGEDSHSQATIVRLDQTLLQQQNSTQQIAQRVSALEAQFTVNQRVKLCWK